MKSIQQNNHGFIEWLIKKFYNNSDHYKEKIITADTQIVVKLYMLYY